MVFHWSLSHSKSSQVSRTLLSILAVLKNVLVLMVSTRPPNSKSSSPFNNPLITVPNASITICMIVTGMSHCFFFQFPSKVEVLILLFTFFQFYSVVSWNSKVDDFAYSLFFLLLLLLAGIRWSVSFEYFTPALSNSFSLEFEWQQVSSCLHFLNHRGNSYTYSHNNT